MTLEKALSYAIEHEGIAIMSEVRLKNYLTDLQAFDSPAIKRIVSTMVEEDYMKKLQSSILSDDYEIHFNDAASRLVKIEGFQVDLVEYVMNCLLYAVNKTKNVPSIPHSDSTSSRVVSKKQKQSSKVDMKVTQLNENFLVDYNGHSYELDTSQYKAIIRKKDMPSDRLEVWLRSYVEENK